MNNFVKTKINYLLKHHFLVPPVLLQKKQYLDDLGLSKMEQKEMLNLIEAEFKIQVSEQEEKRIRTVNDTVYLLDKYLAFNTSITIG